MQTITLIFCGSPRLYIQEIGLFSIIEKAYRTRTEATAPFCYITKSQSVSFDILFCKNPTRDNVYEEYNKYMDSAFHDPLPPPADEIAKTIADDTIVLVFGLCGSLNGPIGEFHTPISFRRLYFHKSTISKFDIHHLSQSKQISINNILGKAMHGARSSIVTTNVTLSPDFIDDGTHMLPFLAQKLAKFAQIVDKESYEIARSCSNRPLGLLLMATDVLSQPELMLYNKRPFTFDRTRFIQAVLTALEVTVHQTAS